MSTTKQSHKENDITNIILMRDKMKEVLEQPEPQHIYNRNKLNFLHRKSGKSRFDLKRGWYIERAEKNRFLKKHERSLKIPMYEDYKIAQTLSRQIYSDHFHRNENLKNPENSHVHYGILLPFLCARLALEHHPSCTHFIRLRVS